MESENLNHIIELSGLSNAAFGKAFGYTKDQIYQYRTGRVKNIPGELIQRICKELDITPLEFRTKDISKTKKNMVVIVNELPDNYETVITDKEVIIKQQNEMIERLKEIITLQKQLLENK